MRNRWLVLAISVLLAAPCNAAASSRTAEKLAQLGRTAQALGSRAADVALDQAADHWFAVDKNGRALAQTGPALAAAIRLARAEALRSGARPVPSELKRALRQHYSPEVLAKARWIVATPQSRLGRLLARWPVRDGAVTLDDVIVFKTARAVSDRRLFAHELAHVEQYHKLGVDRFADRYSRNRAHMENEAQAKARQVVQS